MKPLHLCREAAEVVAITGCLLLYGVLQERIMTIGFGEGRELFKHSISLVLCNRLCTCLLAFFIMVTSGSNLKPAAPMHSYLAVSFTNVISTSCQYEALKHISFVVQTLTKSAKALPVMLWGTLYYGKVYKLRDYLQVLTITLGCTLFVLTGDISSRVVQDKNNLTYLAAGTALMMGYLIVDGLTSTMQDNMFSTYNMGICELVFYTTAWSTVLSFGGAVLTGQLMPSINFVLRNLDALWWILALSLLSAAVQLVISYTIQKYGAVVFATIMTTRQFFSILLSCAIFQMPLTAWQWASVAIVFGAIQYKMYARALEPDSAIKDGASASGQQLMQDVEPKNEVILEMKNPLLSKSDREEADHV